MSVISTLKLSWCIFNILIQNRSFSMKIRIKGNSIRFRLTKTEVQQYIEKGFVEEKTQIAEQLFSYGLTSTATSERMYASIQNNKITIFLPLSFAEEWASDDKIGFYDTIEQSNGSKLSLTVEKDFVCLDDRDEDESDNYPNPKAGLLKS